MSQTSSPSAAALVRRLLADDAPPFALLRPAYARP